MDRETQILIGAGILLAVIFYAIYQFDKPRQAYINKHNCAVLGYYEDCKTPLPEEKRLK